MGWGCLSMKPCSVHTGGKHPSHVDVYQLGHLPAGAGSGRLEVRAARGEAHPEKAGLRVGGPGPWGQWVGGGGPGSPLSTLQLWKATARFLRQFENQGKVTLKHCPKQKCSWRSASAPVTSRASTPRALGGPVSLCRLAAGAGLCAQPRGPPYSR